jgi:protein-disulfide isomerase-like protein with CxxC motif
MKLKRIDPNLAIAIGVLIASFSALFVYIKQASIMSEQTRILLEQTKVSSFPHLIISMDQSYNKNGIIGLGIHVTNKGMEAKHFQPGISFIPF